MHADELADLLRWCATLSTDPADLAGEVMVAAGQRWSVLVDSPADLRELTVRTFLKTTQAPKLAVREGIDRVPEELRAVVAAYDQLPKLQRAVLMLSYLEDITNTEIAGLVDRTPARVRLELDRGLAAIGGDVGGDVGILHGCLRHQTLYDEHLAWHTEPDNLTSAA